MQVARDEARARGIINPTILAPETAHPAFEKACKYLDVERVRIPLRDDMRADPNAYRSSIDERTILLVGSAPCYPYGVIDPIAEIVHRRRCRVVVPRGCVFGRLAVAVLAVDRTRGSPV